MMAKIVHHRHFLAAARIFVVFDLRILKNHLRTIWISRDIWRRFFQNISIFAKRRRTTKRRPIFVAVDYDFQFFRQSLVGGICRIFSGSWSFSGSRIFFGSRTFTHHRIFVQNRGRRFENWPMLGNRVIFWRSLIVRKIQIRRRFLKKIFSTYRRRDILWLFPGKFLKKIFSAYGRRDFLWLFPGNCGESSFVSLKKIKNKKPRKRKFLKFNFFSHFFIKFFKSIRNFKSNLDYFFQMIFFVQKSKKQKIILFGNQWRIS